MIDYAEWIEPLLAAGAAGDAMAARMYDVCSWIVAGGETDSATVEMLDAYINWIQETGKDE